MTMRVPEELDAEDLNRKGRLAAQMETFRERYKRRKKAGLCVRGDDHGPHDKGSIYCAPCRVDFKAEGHDRYMRTRGPRRLYKCSRCERPNHSRRSCTTPEAQLPKNRKATS
jgi:hypothetical protein